MCYDVELIYYYISNSLKNIGYKSFTLANIGCDFGVSQGVVLGCIFYVKFDKIFDWWWYNTYYV